MFQLSDDSAEPALVTRTSVPGDARGFTPPSSDCLERGRRYAWSVAASGALDELQWSAPFLFEIEAAPSLDELEQAIATIERYRAHGLRDVSTPAAAGRAADVSVEPVNRDSPREPVRTRRPRALPALDGPLPAALTAPTSGVTRVTSAATPALGNPSIGVSANVALGADSNLFKK